MRSAAQPDLFSEPRRVFDRGVREVVPQTYGEAYAPARPINTDALDERETLQMLVSRFVPSCGNPGAASAALYLRFGCIARVFGASEAELAPIVGHAAAADIRLLRSLLLTTLRFEISHGPLLSSWSAVQGYLKASLAGDARESFRVIFLDNRNQLIADELMGEGTINHAPVYPREVVKRCLELNAASILLVHNHPSGCSNPSAADISMTNDVIKAAKALGISVHDHYLVAGSVVVSFKTRGLI